jgi:integrase/recombinase XerD
MNKPIGRDDKAERVGSTASLPSVMPSAAGELPAIINDAGDNARFAYEEFLDGHIANPHTRAAYEHALHKLLVEMDLLGLALHQITPKAVRSHLQRLCDARGTPVSVPTQKLHLAAIRKFFDIAVTRHAIMLNPAASVRAARHSVVEGKTAALGIKQIRTLLRSITRQTQMDYRDHAIIATLTYTGVRIGAVAKLRIKDFYRGSDQWYLRFSEKGGKSREIPVRHDLQQVLQAYLLASKLDSGATTPPHPDDPFFRSANRKTGKLTASPLHRNNACMMLKRRMKKAGLASRFSAHSFRVAVATDLLSQDVPLEQVQQLLGHADPRTTRLYDRRGSKVTRNVVERISV